MDQVLEKIIEMNLFGSVAIIAVIFLRLLFAKVPKKITVWFWLVAAIRLLCPVNFSSALSIFNNSKMASVKTAARKVPSVVNNKVFEQAQVHNAIKYTVTDAPQISEVQTGASLPDMNTIMFMIWIAGMAVLALLIIFRSVRIVRRLGLKGMEGSSGVYELKGITTSFVIGLFDPKICIPVNISGFEREYILIHERIHIKNKDQLIKAVMLIILCIHWFNPIVWIMYRLLVTDLEMRCDEEVIDIYGDKIKTDYCVSMVMNATEGINHIAVLDSTFAKKTIGGLEIKMRIMNLVKYRKIPAIAAALCLAVAIGSVWILSSNASNDKVKTAVAETTVETAKAKTAKKKSASKKKPAVKTGTCVKASEITNTVSDDNNILIYNSIPEKAEKIVSLDSDTTRNLVDMYVTDKLVGVDTESAYRWEQLDKSIDVLRSADDIIAASPDIVFSRRSNYPSDYNDNVEQELIDAGICLVKIPPCISLEYTKEDIRFIGELIDDTGRADDLVSSFEEQISTVSSYCADIKESEKRSVVFIRYQSTLLNESPYRNFKEISDLIGAKDLPVYEFEYDNSDEFRKKIQDMDPDVIIFEDMGMYMYNDFTSDKRFKDMKAVKNNTFGCIEFDKFRSTNVFDLSESIYRTWSAVYPESYDEMESNQPNS